MKITSLATLSEAVKVDSELKAQIEALEERKKALRDDITAYLKKNALSSVTVEGNRVSYAPYSTTRFDKERFEQEHAKLYQKYMKTDWFTRLTITPKKEKPQKGKKPPKPEAAVPANPTSDGN